MQDHEHIPFRRTNCMQFWNSLACNKILFFWTRGSVKEVTCSRFMKNLPLDVANISAMIFNFHFTNKFYSS